jgi:uncharacterized surface protein with fasciclin (FAS1) repeats
MRRIAISLVAALALSAPLAASATAAGHAATRKNIVQLASSDPQLSTLVSLVKKAGLAKVLATAKVTVFAPTNAAFAAVPKATLDKIASSKALLTKVLEYHVVAGLYPAAKVEGLKSAKTLEGARVHFHVRHGSVYVNKAKVVAANVRASNGIVHVINAVLVPPGA